MMVYRLRRWDEGRDAASMIGAAKRLVEAHFLSRDFDDQTYCIPATGDVNAVVP